MALTAKKRFDFAPQQVIITAALLKERSSFTLRQFQSRAEYVLDSQPRFSIHSAGHIAHCMVQIHKRAVAHSRLVVAGEMFSTSAVSSIERPPKKRSSTIRHWRGSSDASLFIALSRARMSTLGTPGAPGRSSITTVTGFAPRFPAECLRA